MTTIPSVASVEQTGPYHLRLRFDDGAEGVFKPLSAPEYFARVRVDEEAGTIVWPNGADLDPLVLHSRVTGVPIVRDSWIVPAWGATTRRAQPPPRW